MQEDKHCERDRKVKGRVLGRLRVFPDIYRCKTILYIGNGRGMWVRLVCEGGNRVCGEVACRLSVAVNGVQFAIEEVG